MRILKKLLWLLPALVGLAIMLVLPHCADIAEYGFARGIFRGLSAVLGAATGWLPFSLTEGLLYTAIAALIVVIALLILRRIRLGRVLRVGGWALSCAFLLYVLMHGANFFRYRTDRLLDLSGTVSVQTVYDVCAASAREATRLRALTQEDENGCFCITGGTVRALTQTDGFYRALSEKYDFLADPVATAKSVAISPLWSYTGITGLYMPLLAEANVNTAAPQSGLFMAAAHELAHTNGFAREDECNFWAYLACSRSGDTDARYSAALYAFQTLADALYTADGALYRSACAELSDAVRRDLAQSAAYWSAHSGAVGDVSEAVNDAFIRAQGQSEGVLAYDLAARLVVLYETSQR